MSDLIKISVAIPVYNGGAYFARAVKSVLEQSYAHKEIIIVNDGSVDDGHTAAVADGFRGPDVTVVHQSNQGVGGAMNTAIQHMSGDIFCWLSHDDLYLPHKLACQVDYYRKLGRRDAILFSDYFLIDGDDNIITEVKMPHRELVETPMLGLLNGCINGCTLFIPLPILRSAGAFLPNLKYTQDYELWNRLLPNVGFFHQPETLIQYRIHPGQDTNKPGAVLEGDALWVRIMQERTAVDRAYMYGSTKVFYTKMAEFLNTTPYAEAQKFATYQALNAIEKTLVSVVIPFFNEVNLVLRAVESVLSQTHSNLEIILVDDGSTEPVEAIMALAVADPRVKLIRQENKGPGAARNCGMRSARGEYIAFLDADDVFLPVKLQLQVAAMQNNGSRICHTSYYVEFPERGLEMSRIDSGAFSGLVYPNVISNCPIATPTVMIHRMLVDAGYEFANDSGIAEDVLFWVDACQKYELLGLSEALTVVEWSSTSAAINLQKSVRALAQLIAVMTTHEQHRRHVRQLGELGNAYRRLLQEYTEQGTHEGDMCLNEEMIEAVFARNSKSCLAE